VNDPQALADQLEKGGTAFLPFTKWMTRSDTLRLARRAIGLTAAGEDGWQLKRGQDGVTVARVGPPPTGTISLADRLVHREPKKRKVFHARDGCGMVTDYPEDYVEAVDIPAVDLRPCGKCFG
jgi:hypothetical protein